MIPRPDELVFYAEPMTIPGAFIVFSVGLILTIIIIILKK